ncbi:Hypothetical predicted protein [Mytilus galloprovincialis]|uniref:MYND-type domain-containing protein n=1 Tax=Mytilus galloprovincialis TaxID=29158 RepID=A0A8B6HLL5_MYTGA|nr:Hypothetical predicted protein [Mytilus galloprovincialis]
MTSKESLLDTYQVRQSVNVTCPIYARYELNSNALRCVFEKNKIYFIDFSYHEKTQKVNYCNQTCQKLHWSTHKKFCKSLAEQYVRIEEMKKKEEELKQKEEELKKHKEDIEKRKGEIETLVEQKEEIEKQIAEQ